MAEHTRSLRGARRLFAWIAATVVAGGAVPAHAAHPDEGVGPLPWRVGGRVGFTVDAAAFPDSQGHTLEVYVRIPPSTLAELTLDSTAVGKVTVEARLKSGYGAKPQEHTETFQVAAGDSAQGFGRVVLLRFPLHTGPQMSAQPRCQRVDHSVAQQLGRLPAMSHPPPREQWLAFDARRDRQPRIDQRERAR